MQRRQMIRLRLQHLRAERTGLVRPPRRKTLRRLQHNPIYSRIAHDAARPFAVEMRVKRATRPNPSVGALGQHAS